MSLESPIPGSSSSSSFNRDLPRKTIPGRDHPAREIKGMIPDADMTKKIGNTPSAKLRGRQIAPINELMLILTEYAKNPSSSKTCGEVAQLILHNNQVLFKEMVKSPATGTLLRIVAQKYNEAAEAAHEDPKMIQMVNKELKKINLADSHKNLEQIEIKELGREMNDLLTNYNEQLLQAPDDKLMNRIGKLISDNLAYFNRGSVESLIIGDVQAKKLIEQLKTLRSRLQQVPDDKKTSVAKQLESLVLKILPNMPEEMQLLMYGRLPAEGPHARQESLKALRDLIKEDAQFGYECLAEWISLSRVDLGVLELSVEELRQVAPLLKHVTIENYKGWDNAEYNRFIDSCKSLTSLKINSMQITELTAKKIEELIHLDCGGCLNLRRLPNSMPYLRILKASSCSAIEKLPKVMPALKSLDIRFTELRGPELEAIAHQLTHLSIGDYSIFSWWNNKRYNRFIQKCTRLESLEITWDKFTDLKAKISTLKSLKCSFCPKLKSLSAKDLPALEEIVLYRTPLNKESLLALAPQLKGVNINKLTELAFTDENDDTWSNKDYYEFFQACIKLKSLSISTPNITSFPPQIAKQLTYFSCVGCSLKTIPPLDNVVFFDYSNSVLRRLPRMPVVKKIVGKLWME